MEAEGNWSRAGDENAAALTLALLGRLGWGRFNGLAGLWFGLYLLASLCLGSFLLAFFRRFVHRRLRVTSRGVLFVRATLVIPLVAVPVSLGLDGLLFA
jgi:hypothetical protein